MQSLKKFGRYGFIREYNRRCVAGEELRWKGRRANKTSERRAEEFIFGLSNKTLLTSPYSGLHKCGKEWLHASSTLRKLRLSQGVHVARGKACQAVGASMELVIVVEAGQEQVTSDSRVFPGSRPRVGFDLTLQLAPASSLFVPFPSFHLLISFLSSLVWANPSA